ncbi:ComF family protein [Sphaerisporangium sp. NPDC051011]|uniref:ComF family protein n=1 Tax=Sphaerisporangium sp. NPDC051011 TaxID=3155792 RepID=UPI0034067715
MLTTVLDLILPPRCAGCGGAGAVLCPSCLGRMRADPFPRTPGLAPRGLPECWAAAPYEGVSRRVILAYKERGRTALRPALAACLVATFVAAAGLPTTPLLLVPVPSAPRAVRRRGHDPVGRLAALAARRLRARGCPVVAAPVLRHRRHVRDQAGLSASERAGNLAGAFEVAGPGSWRAMAATAARRGLPGRPVAVLVDDIVTTGVTLAEAAGALRAAGVAVPLAVALAATRRHL